MNLLHRSRGLMLRTQQRVQFLKKKSVFPDEFREETKECLEKWRNIIINKHETEENFYGDPILIIEYNDAGLTARNIDSHAVAQVVRNTAGYVANPFPNNNTIAPLSDSVKTTTTIEDDERRTPERQRRVENESSSSADEKDTEPSLFSPSDDNDPDWVTQDRHNISIDFREFQLGSIEKLKINPTLSYAKEIDMILCSEETWDEVRPRPLIPKELPTVADLAVIEYNRLLNDKQSLNTKWRNNWAKGNKLLTDEDKSIFDCVQIISRNFITYLSSISYNDNKERRNF
ncbi:unnamed protein product [Rhizophagus irregularis]|uniref:Uncharacterized protein n=1 Tax=Rhizophagus irregularis TaxID=588596 RepID=A0A916DYI4_9GLOM|nr:unnamed protein product [Rhizophagus irregularis]